MRVLQLRNYLARHLVYPRRNKRYHLSQMIFALLYPIILGLDRLETASFLHSNGTFQYLTGLPGFPNPQTLRRFLIQAPAGFQQQLSRINDRLLQIFVHRPSRRSRLIFDLDSTVLTVFGRQEKAEIGYNPRYRGKRSYHPLLCMESNSSYLWDLQLRPGNTSVWGGTVQLIEHIFSFLSPDIREVRFRADSSFMFEAVLKTLEDHSVDYAIVARLHPSIKRHLAGLNYQPAVRGWEVAEFHEQPQDWSRRRRFIVARHLLKRDEPQPTLFLLGRYVYRVWVTNLPLTPIGVWYFYDGRAVIEPRINELREDFALRRIPTHSFSANATYHEIIRLAYNLVTAFQRTCLPDPWKNMTLQKLRYKLFLLPGELTRPQNRPTLRLKDSKLVQDLVKQTLKKIHKLPTLNG